MTLTVDAQAAEEKSYQGISVNPYFWAVVGTILTVVFGGYQPLGTNNIYHLPVLLKSYDLPQFVNDPFVQSVRNFSSGFWILFAGAGKYLEPKLFFAAWLIVTHFLFLSSAVHLAGSLGCRDSRARSLFVIALAAAALTNGGAAGGGGVSIDSFSHSELANSSMLMAFSFVLSKRYGFSAFMVCLTFFLNAFMGVWAALPVTLAAIAQLFSGQTDLRKLVRDTSLGLFLGAILVFPVLRNLVSNSEALVNTSFSYRDYLRGSFPEHFFIMSLTFKMLGELLGLSVLLMLTVQRHGKASMAFCAIAAGALAIVFLGTLAPLLTDSRSILNLHLIRGFVVAHMLAEISLLAYAAMLVFQPRQPSDRFWGVILTAAMLMPRPLWLLTIPILLFKYYGIQKYIDARPKYLIAARRFGWLFLALCIVMLPIRVVRKWDYLEGVIHATQNWEAMGTWANQNTDPMSVFLLLPGDAPDSALGFSYTSDRQLWIDWKYGAAVMWSPSYISTWNSRYTAWRALKTVPAALDYMRAENIDYLVANCAQAGQPEPVYQEGALCVYAAQ